ncbi:MAG: hypothetical protein R2701_05120 [Acidimicrobiales bacterium]
MDPAVARGDALDALHGGWRHGRDPQPAIGGEALLRGEVVDVGLGGVEAQATGRGGGVDGHERTGIGPAGRTIGMATPVEVSLWVRA